MREHLFQRLRDNLYVCHECGTRIWVGPYDPPKNVQDGPPFLNVQRGEQYDGDCAAQLVWNVMGS